MRVAVATDAPEQVRVLPHNTEAERTVLGAVFVDNGAFNSVAELLTREDFYSEAHRRVFDGMEHGPVNPRAWHGSSPDAR